MNGFVCRDLQQLAQEVRLGAGAILLTEEVIGAEGVQQLLEALKQQPTWSNMPIVMLMKEAVTSPTATRILRRPAECHLTRTSGADSFRGECRAGRASGS